MNRIVIIGAASLVVGLGAGTGVGVSRGRARVRAMADSVRNAAEEAAAAARDSLHRAAIALDPLPDSAGHPRADTAVVRQPATGSADRTAPAAGTASPAGAASTGGTAPAGATAPARKGMAPGDSAAAKRAGEQSAARQAVRAGIVTAGVPGSAPTSVDTARVGQLARLFGAMSARDAAKVLVGLDQSDAHLVLSAMDNRRAAEILANFPPERATELSRLILRSGRP